MNSFLLLVRTQDCTECTSCRGSSKHGTRDAGRVRFSSARGTSRSRDVICLSATSSNIKLQPSGSFHPQEEECISCSVAIKHFSLLKARRSRELLIPQVQLCLHQCLQHLLIDLHTAQHFVTYIDH